MNKTKNIKKKNILIIEDDIQLAITIANILDETKIFKTHIASSGAVGIQKGFQIIPNIIICDIIMPNIDGYQVFKTFKESSLTSLIPFVFLTGKSEIEDMRLGMQLGADDYIVKPFNNEELLLSIKTRLEKHEKMVKLSFKNFNNLLNLTPNPVFIHNKNEFVKINYSFTETFGYNINELNNMSIMDMIAKENQKKANLFIDKILSGIYGEKNCEILIIKKNGEIIKSIIHCKNSTDVKGQTIIIGCLLKENNENFLLNDFASTTLMNLSSINHNEEDLISPNLAEKLKKIYTKKNENENQEKIKTSDLSQREKEVLCLSFKGLPMKQIADLLCISNRTVEKHRTNLMHKTNTKNIVELIIYSIKNNLIKIK